MSNSTTLFAVDEIDKTRLTTIKKKFIQDHSSTYTPSTENDKVLENIIIYYLILEKSYQSYNNFCQVYESIQNELVEELSDGDKFVNTREKILRNAVVLVQIYKFIETGQRYSLYDLWYQLPINVRISPSPPIGCTGFGCDDFTNSERRKEPNIKKLQGLCYKGKNKNKSSIGEKIIEKYFILLNIIPGHVTDKMNELKKKIPCLTFSNDLSQITIKYQGKRDKPIPTCILSPIINLSKKRHTLPYWSKAQWQHCLRNCHTIINLLPLNNKVGSRDCEPTSEEKSFWKKISLIGMEEEKKIPKKNKTSIKTKRKTKHKHKSDDDDDDDDDVFKNNNQSGHVIGKATFSESEDEVDDGNGDGGVAGGAGSGGAGDELTEESKIEQDKIACHANQITSIPTTSNPGGGSGDGGGSGGGGDNGCDKDSGGGGDGGGSGGGGDNGCDKGSDDDNESNKVRGNTYVTSLVDSNISDHAMGLISGYMQEGKVKKVQNELEKLKTKLEKLKKKMENLENSQEQDKDAIIALKEQKELNASIDSKKKELTELNGELIITELNEDITRGCFMRLLPDCCLNDSIINFYLKCCLLELMNEKKSYVCSTHFYSSLMDHDNKMYRYGNISRWRVIKDGSLSTMSKVYIPINQGNQHWVLVVIDNHSKTITYYDSLMNENYFNESTKEINNKVINDCLENITLMLKDFDKILPDYQCTSVHLPRQEGGEFMNLCIYLSCYLNSLTSNLNIISFT